VQRRHHGDVVRPAGLQDGRADERERVVHVDDIWAAILEQRRHVRAVRWRPDGPAGDQRPLEQGGARDVVAGALVRHHVVTRRAQESRLLIDDQVLATRLDGPIPVVHDDDAHG
jgi:hypothetical protein